MNPPLPIDGVLPPDLQGTLVRVAPGRRTAADEAPPPAAALVSIELRDGAAVSYLTAPTTGDANVFWHANSILALAEAGLPQRYTRLLEPQDSDGGLTQDIASHVHRDTESGARTIFALEAATETSNPLLRVGEWDPTGALTHHMSIDLTRHAWHHDLGVTATRLALMESPTEFAPDLAEAGSPVPYRWTPGAEGWLGLLARDGDGTDLRWIRQDPCLVTHVLGAYDEPPTGPPGGPPGPLVMYVVRYPVPESGQPFDLESSVVGDGGIGQSTIGGGLGVLEHWRIEGQSCERIQVDERHVEYVQADPLCEGRPFRFGYGVELALAAGAEGDAGRADPIGLLQFDLAKDGVREWHPGEYRVASEPLFVRAADGNSDDEGWLLTVVHDATRGASDLYVLDASSFGPGRAPQAIIHLPESLPFRSHGTWIGADRYR